VTAAFKIITADPNVKGILINIFGGIMHCDVIAEGVIAAVREVQLKVPLVVRLEGTNVALGERKLAECGLRIEQQRQRRRISDCEFNSNSNSDEFRIVDCGLNSNGNGDEFRIADF